MKKPYLSTMGRRTFIKSAAGATFALPLMPSLFGEEAAAAGGSAKNFFFMRCGNGVQQRAYNQIRKEFEIDRFWPDAPAAAQTPLSAALFEKKLSDGRTCALQELKAHADKLLLMQGMAYHNWRNAPSGCGHAEGGIRCFTASLPQEMGKKNRARASGISFDWFLYNQFDKREEWQPLILSSGVTSSYLGPVLSYRSAGTVESPQYNPWSIYKALFGLGGGTPEAERQAQLIAQQQNSVNDFVREELADLVNPRKVSKEDWEKLERHKASIRDIEVKVAQGACGLTDWDAIQSQFEGKDDKNIQRSELTEAITKLHMDIVALSFSCGLRRNVSLQIGSGNDQTTYKTLSNPKGQRFHWISHRIESDGGFKAGESKVIQDADIWHHEIDRMFASWFGYFIDRLKELQALDDTIAVWTNDISTGTHHKYNLPYVLAGGGNVLKNGRMIDFNPDDKSRGNGSDKWATHDRMFNTIASALGVGGTPKFGVDTQGGNLPLMLK